MSEKLFILFMDSSEWRDEFYVVRANSDMAACEKANFKYKGKNDSKLFIENCIDPVEFKMDDDGVSQLLISTR